MARMTLRAVRPESERRRITLSERIVDENLDSYQHVPLSREPARPVRRDAEALQAQAGDRVEARHHDDDPGYAQLNGPAARRGGRRSDGGDPDEEPTDVAWLYAWSHVELRQPIKDTLAAHLDEEFASLITENADQSILRANKPSAMSSPPKSTPARRDAHPRRTPARARRMATPTRSEQASDHKGADATRRD